MARERFSEDSDSDLPDLDEIINKHVKGLHVLSAPKLEPSKAVPARLSPPKATGRGLYPDLPTVQSQFPQSAKESATDKRHRAPAPKVQDAKKESKPRRKAHTSPEDKEESSTLAKALERSHARTKTTPYRRPKTFSSRAPAMEDGDSEKSDEEGNAEESIYCDSDSEEMPRTANRRFARKNATKSRGRTTPEIESSGSESEDFVLKPRSRQPRQTSKTGPTKGQDDLTAKLLQLDLESSSDKENDNQAFLRFSPPRSNRPVLSRPATPPPASPTKSRLVSPSKKKYRIPTPPHAPHIDEFWNVHTVNDWNDQYSPQKPLLSPKKNKSLERSDSDSPLSSPKKNQSPSKRSRAVLDAKKDFESRKHQLCEEFFHELDSKITDGKIKELAGPSGGVHFIWSKTLNTTAGRANWKRETSKTRNLDGTTTITQKHHASIELAEKVIDDEERLLNVVAHEFCHLANFMVSGIKDQPHGHQFKVWGQKCTEAFGNRGVEVTTKHSYRIDYKYIWTCSNELCGQEFKRHSKSIDPARQSCGVCRGKLAQTKPVPRKQAGATGYAAFVKEHFATLKKEMVGASHKEVMGALGQKYRDQKAAAAAAAAAAGATAGVDDVAKALEVVTLDSD